LKILHIAKYYEPFKGGIEKVILELATGTVKAGHEVVVLSSNHENRYVEEDIEGVKVIRLPRYGVAFSQPLTFGLLWQAKKWMQWADVVQVHTPNPLAELSFLQQDVLTPLIVTYHCDVVSQRSLHKLYRPVAEKLLSRANAITVSTPNHLEYSEILQAYKDKARVIPFGVRAKHAKKTLEINQHLKKIKDELGDYFLFIGRLVPYKGVDVLLHAMQNVDQNLVILGQGPRWEAWYLLAQQLGVQDRVRLIGRVDDDDEFSAYLHGCTSLVLPSINEAEAFGLVLIEAMSCSKPVITTKLFSGVPWVNDKGVTGLEVMPKDPLGLAGAMNELANNHERRQQMQRAARERFERLFTVDKMVNSYLVLYQNVLPGQRLAA
jgi:glycosyltransferase involved in cell wall biosynthesis